MTQPESHYIFDGRFKLKSISLCLRRQIEALRWRFGRSNSLRVCRDKVFVAHTVIFWRRLSANMNADRNFTSISLYKKQNVTVCKCRERRAQCVVGNVISAIFVRFPSHTVFRRRHVVQRWDPAEKMADVKSRGEHVTAVCPLCCPAAVYYGLNIKEVLECAETDIQMARMIYSSLGK